MLLVQQLLYSGNVLAQVIPPDESLTDGPAVQVRDSIGQSKPLITSETIEAASPAAVVVDSASAKPARRRLFGRNADQDSTFVDTAGIKFFKKVFSPVYPNPERAAALSFVLPGAGQIYNKRLAYIKVPILYAGYGALIYNGEQNRRIYNRYKTAYRLRLAGESHEFSNTRFDSPAALSTQRDKFDKNFQLSYIGVGILHLVQMLEAYTTAHLLDFDINENLSLSPAFQTSGGLWVGNHTSIMDDNGTSRPRLGLRVSWVF